MPRGEQVDPCRDIPGNIVGKLFFSVALYLQSGSEFEDTKKFTTIGNFTSKAVLSFTDKEVLNFTSKDGQVVLFQTERVVLS